MSNFILPRNWNRPVRYAVAFAAVTLALLCRLALNEYLQNASPFMYFFVAIIVSGWLGGLGPGLTATALSTLAVSYFYLPPLGSLLLGSSNNFIQSISFLCLGTVISLIINRMRREQRRAEQAAGQAQLNEIRYRATYEHADIGIERLDEHDQLVDVNPALCQMLGYTSEELLGRTCIELMHPDDRAEDVRLLEQLKRHEIPSYKLEKRYMHKDGRPVWVRETSSLAPQEAGFFRIAVVEDINDRKRAEEAQRESEERFRIMADSLPQLAWIAQADGFIFWYNRRWYDYTGTSPEQMEGWGWQSVHDPQVLPQVLEQWKGSIATGEPFEMVFPLRGGDGRFRRFLTRVMPIKDVQGRVTQWFGTNTDVDELKRTEEALRQSEERLRATFDNAALGIVETDNKDRFVAVNEPLCQILGYRREELLGMSVHDLTAPEDRPRSDDLNAQLHDGRSKRIEYEKRYLRKDGMPLWVHVTIAAVRDSEGRYLHSIGTVEDISRRKAAEEQLHLQAKALNAAANGIIVTNPDGTILWINQAFTTITGYSTEELIGKNPRLLKSGKQDEAFYRAMWETIRRGEVWHGELVNRRKGGSLYTEEMVIAPVIDEYGAISHYIAIKQDITERKRIEKRLRDSERRLADIIEFLPDATFALDNAGRVIVWNKAMEELTGAPAADVIGKGNQEHTFRLYGKRIPCLADSLLRGDIAEWAFSNVIKENEIIKAETFIPHLKPGGVWLAIKVAPMYDAQGNIIGVIDSCRDITDRKRAEETHRASEERYRVAAEELQAVMDATPAGICVAHDPQCHLITGNHPAHELFGVPPGGNISATPSDRDASPYFRIYRDGREVPGQDLPMQVAGATGAVIRDVELVAVRRDEAERVFLINAAPLRSPDGTIRGSVGAFTDITERKRAENALRESEERFRTLADSSPVLIWVNGPEGCEFVNRAYLEFLGVSPEDVHSFDWTQFVHPEDRQPYVNAYLDAVARREPFAAQFRFRRADGEYRWMQSAGRPRFHEAGGFQGYVGSTFDINDMKQAEDALRVANERLQEADRRKDEFMAMLAHELRNPLAPIRYAAQMLRLAGTAPESLQKQREVIDRQVSHMGRLLDDLLDISRITRGKITLKREIVDLRAVAAQALDSMRPMIEGRGQHLLYEGPSSPLTVDGDPTRLEQIIRNMLHNANKYTEAGGCIKLSLGLENGQEHQWRAVIRVSDSGIGITPEMLPHVFEAFVQAEQGLARSQGGLGIGLAMVRKLVELHGGTVQAHSTGPGRGSEFVVQLPLAAPAVIEPPRHEPFAAVQKTQSAPCRVLVVDDNEDSAASLSELLGLWGHEVQTAYDGRHALETARAWRPEVILLDIGLPGMDGYQVAGHLRREPDNERAFIVALTGYGAEEDRRRAQEAGFDHHLTKPVELEQLQEILNRRCAA